MVHHFTKIVAGITLAGCLAVAGVSRAADTPSVPSTSPSLENRLNALQNRLMMLQADQANRDADTQYAINKILKDADQNSQPFTSPYLSGWDPNTGFVIASPDGQFQLHPFGLWQFRDMNAYRQNIPTGGGGTAGGSGTDFASGFQSGFTQFGVDGRFFSDLYGYRFQWGGYNGNMAAQDSYVTARLSNQSPYMFKIGQFKDPIYHEENVYEGNLMAVDRSITDAFLGGGQTGRVLGLGALYDVDRFRGQLIADNGNRNTFYRTGNVTTTAVPAGSLAGIGPTDFGLSTRAEYLLIGDRTPQFNPYSQYDQFTSRLAKQNSLVAGAGAGWYENGGNNVYLHTIDAQYNSPSGWAAYGAYQGAYRVLPNGNYGVSPGFFYDNGVVLQTSYAFNKHVEVFGRYDYTHLDGNALASTTIQHDTIHEFTIGANYYLYGQNAKFTIDASFLPSGMPMDLVNEGYLQNDGHNEILLRAQAQVWF